MTTWETKQLKKASQNQTASEEGYSRCSRTTCHLWLRRVAMWSDYILNIYIYTYRPMLFSALLLFFQWVKLMQTLITDLRLKIRDCKGQPHQDTSVTTTPICQGSGGSIDEEAERI